MHLLLIIGPGLVTELGTANSYTIMGSWFSPTTIFLPLPSRERAKKDSASSTPPTPQFHPSPVPLKPSRAPKPRHEVVMKSFCTHASHMRVCCESFTWYCRKAGSYYKDEESISNYTPCFLESKCDILSTEGNLIALHLCRWLIKHICLSSS